MLQIVIDIPNDFVDYQTENGIKQESVFPMQFGFTSTNASYWLRLPNSPGSISMNS
jgi:hypothetical protein